MNTKRSLAEKRNEFREKLAPAIRGRILEREPYVRRARGIQLRRVFRLYLVNALLELGRSLGSIQSLGQAVRVIAENKLAIVGVIVSRSRGAFLDPIIRRGGASCLPAEFHSKPARHRPFMGRQPILVAAFAFKSECQFSHPTELVNVRLMRQNRSSLVVELIYPTRSVFTAIQLTVSTRTDP